MIPKDTQTKKKALKKTISKKIKMEFSFFSYCILVAGEIRRNIKLPIELLCICAIRGANESFLKIIKKDKKLFSPENK